MAKKSIDAKKVAKAFSKRLASHEVSDQAVESLAKQVVNANTRPIGIDICQFGICIDYRTPRSSLGELINRLERDRTIGGIRIFPEGIIDPDDFRVAVDYILER